MTEKKTNEFEKTAFVIGPIGSEASIDRRKIDGLIDTILQPILDDHDLKALASHQISKSGSINAQIIEHLLKDKLVICNLTGLNPNVMYELAIRHAAMLPVVLIAERGTKNPFDIFGERTIFYEDSFKGVNELKDNLKVAIKETFEAKTVDTPVSRVIGHENVLKQATSIDPTEYLIKRMDTMENVMSQIHLEVKKQPVWPENPTWSDIGQAILPGISGTTATATPIVGRGYRFTDDDTVDLVQVIIKGEKTEIEKFEEELINHSSIIGSFNPFEHDEGTNYKLRINPYLKSSFNSFIVKLSKKYKKLEILYDNHK